MKLIIFFLIFSLQFILYSCFTVKYYNSLIKKYADEVKVTTGDYIAVGFVLDISEFKENDPIYFTITLSDRDAKYGVSVLINFDSTFDFTEYNLNDFDEINKKSTTSSTNGRTSYYYETTKDFTDLNYLTIVVYSNSGFSNKIGFENTKEDGAKKANKEMIIILAVVLGVIVITVIIILVLKYCCKKKSKNNEDKTQGQYGQQIITQPQFSNQQYNTQPQIYNQKQMYSQPQVYNQQQMYQQGMYTGNNVNNAYQYQSDNLVNNPNEISPMNEK